MSTPKPGKLRSARASDRRGSLATTAIAGGTLVAAVAAASAGLVTAGVAGGALLRAVPVSASTGAAPVATSATAPADAHGGHGAGGARGGQGAGDVRGGPADHVAGEVVLGLRDGGEHVVPVPRGLGVPRARALLERLPEIRYANRNWRARAAVVPLDQGSAGVAGGWRQEQWNFLGRPGGIRTLGAWRRLERVGSPGAQGVRIAVVDTGIAYADSDRPPGFRRSPGFTDATEFGHGRDFVDGGPPLDRNGHGTHIAGTIAEQVTTGEPAQEGDPDYLTGLAYNATLIPVRVLDHSGEGTAATVARGIRWAARNGADVVNVSVQLPARVRRCAQVRPICRAVRQANRRGALVVAAAGNSTGGHPRVLFPAAAPGAVAVGAATESGCLASYSHHGRRLDLLAPGGGGARPNVAQRACPDDSEPIRQVSFRCFAPGLACSSDFGTFAIVPARGTSMAAAHVSGVAAMVRAARSAGQDPGPRRLRRWLRCSSRPLGRRWFHGAGLLDAARATSRQPPPRCRG